MATNSQIAFNPQGKTVVVAAATIATAGTKDGPAQALGVDRGNGLFHNPFLARR